MLLDDDNVLLQIEEDEDASLIYCKKIITTQSNIFLGDQSSLLMQMNSSDSGEFKTPFEIAKDRDDDTIFIDDLRD